jgi:hypothetical protein
MCPTLRWHPLFVSSLAAKNAFFTEEKSNKAVEEKKLK